MKDTHGLIADIVSFKGPHINHLTPKILDIDECQVQFKQKEIKAKEIVEGPPKRNCPILLRQTSFIAIAEDIVFTDGEVGSHTARFGEVEQRGIALTPKGRELYDQLIMEAKNGDSKIEYGIRLKEAFRSFPDDYEQIRKQKLGYFFYSLKATKQNEISSNEDIEALICKGLINITPITYEDFLPVSAAGIFSSNLDNQSFQDNKIETDQHKRLNDSKLSFEQALGVKVKNSFKLYEKLQQKSIERVLECLKVNK